MEATKNLIAVHTPVTVLVVRCKTQHSRRERIPYSPIKSLLVSFGGKYGLVVVLASVSVLAGATAVHRRSSVLGP